MFLNNVVTMPMSLNALKVSLFGLPGIPLHEFIVAIVVIIVISVFFWFRWKGKAGE